MNVADLGRRIRVRREKKQLTQAQLANSLHISAQAVSKWERGENAPDISILKPLSTILERSIEWILTGNDEVENTFEATVLCTSLRTFAQRSSQTTPEKIALWVNGLFHTMTEAVLSFDGVPVKYTGDGFLAYFSGRDHQQRAFSAVTLIGETVEDKALLMTLSCGPIYLGTIGHHEYASLDILGDTVNHTFMLNRWAHEECEARLVVADKLFEEGHCPKGLSAQRRPMQGGNNVAIEIVI